MPAGINQRVVVDEARLVALYVVAVRAQEILDMEEGIPGEDELATSVLRLMDQTPIGPGLSIAEHIVANKDDL